MSDGTDWQGSNVTAGENLTLQSGADINLIGSRVGGEQVTAQVGGDLNIESLQNTSRASSEQKSSSVAINVGFSGSGNMGGSFSHSKAKAEGEYASVNEYAGIFAGDKGFNVTVEGNTDLAGAIITSNQKAIDEGKNSLTTGTLTTSDIENRSHYEAKSSGISIGGGFGSGGFSPTPGIPTSGKKSGSESSTTTSGVSEGTITITNEDKQKELTGQTNEEVITSLNTDVTTSSSANGLNKNWDVKELVDEMQVELEITQAFNEEFAKTVQLLASDEREDAAKKLLDPNLSETDRKYYQDIAEGKGGGFWGMGGNGRLIATAIAGALSSNVGGANTDILQGAVVNFIQDKGAHLVKKYVDDNHDKDDTIRSIFQGILACGGAAAQGSGCTSAALGASSAVLINHLMGGTKIKDPITNELRELTPEEKEDRLNLVNSIIGGVTEALGGDANAAVVAAKVEMENNFLSPSALKHFSNCGNVGMMGSTFKRLLLNCMI